MSYSSSEPEAQDLGFTLPKGTDLIRNGDDAITTNARVATGAIRHAFNRITALEERPSGGGTVPGPTPGEHEHPQYVTAEQGDGRYAPLAHTHTVGNVTGLQAALDGKAATSHTHTAAAVGAVPASRFLTGTGMPNGVVAAPVGTEYTDTAGTNGAYKWLKATGTGNTGWIVTFGDTGVRNISSLLINGWAPSNSDRWTIRRMNNIVTIGGYITGPSTTSDDVMRPIPAGFYGYDATGSWREFSSSSTKAGVVLVQRGSSGIITLRDAKGGTNIFTSVTFSTTDAWPTTLPGLPA